MNGEATAAGPMRRIGSQPDGGGEIGVDGDTGRIVEDSYENPKSSD